MDEHGVYYTDWSKSERETPIYYINAYIYGILKDGNNNPIGKTAKEKKYKEQTFDYVGEGESGMIWENSIETCILPYVK